jgi:hypothetical protein
MKSLDDCRGENQVSAFFVLTESPGRDCTFNLKAGGPSSVWADVFVFSHQLKNIDRWKKEYVLISAGLAVRFVRSGHRP